MEEGMIIESLENPEWGTWVVCHEEVSGVWMIKGRAGNICLSESEFNRFWKEVVK